MSFPIVERSSHFFFSLLFSLPAAAASPLPRDSRFLTLPINRTLYRDGLIDPCTHFVGYARSALTTEVLVERIRGSIKVSGEQEKELFEKFLSRCTYVSGDYSHAVSVFLFLSFSFYFLPFLFFCLISVE